MLHELVTGGQVDGIRRGEIDLGLARPPFDTSVLSSRLLRARAAAGRRRPRPPAGLAPGGRSAPEDFDGEPVIGYHPTSARYFYELTVRFLVIGHSRVVHTCSQILTAVILVAAGQGVAFVPASAPPWASRASCSCR